MTFSASKKYLIKNSYSTLFRVGVSSLSTLIITPFIIKNIGLSLYGYISFTTFFTSYAGIFDIGISKALVFLINGADVSENQKNKYISAFYIINIIIISVIAAAGIISVYLKLPILGEAVSSNTQYYTLITIVSILILIFSIFNMLQYAILEAFLQLDKANYGIMLNNMVLNALFLINLFTINNIEFYILSALISVIINTVYNSFAITRTVSFTLTKVEFSYMKNIFRVSIKFAGVGIFSSINSAMPRIAITYLSNGLASIAILDVISKLSMSIINLGGSIARPFFALTRIDTNGIKRHWKQIFTVYLTAGLSFILFVVLFRNQITGYFFHDIEISWLLNYLLIIYVVAAVIYLFGQPLSMFLMGIGKINLVSKVIGFNTLVFIVMFIICDRFITDVLISLSIANIIMAISYTLHLLIFSNKQYS